MNQTTTDLEEEGLSSGEVQKRLSEYGFNEVPERRVSPVVRFLRAFWGATPWMLELTIFLEWFLGKYLETYVMIGLLVFNAVTGFIQEERANAAIELLRRELKVDARVKRDGEWRTIPARELVPGDIVRLRSGDFVPADTGVIEGNVDVDQSALTGESLTIERKTSDHLFSGSIIKRGEITGIVTDTGPRTYFGRTVELVQTAKPRLHMEQVISKVTRWLLAMVIATLSVGTVLSILKGFPAVEIVPLATILLLSAVPVALPTMFTISMALGSLELSKRGALVTRLDAVEDAATMDVVCVDKTGTITMNRLSVADVVPVGEYRREDVILYGALASQEANLDPIDLAFLSAAKEVGILLDGYLQKKFVPFDPSTRRTQATIEKEGKQFYVSKGAAKVIVQLCKNSQEELARIDQTVEGLSTRGYRAIAVASGPAEDDLKLVGVAALYDRPRSDSQKLIKELQSLAVSVKMLTGDALPIAKEVAVQVGLDGNIIRISDLRSKKDENVDLGIEKTSGFAEIYPEDKYLVVKSLQVRGHIVGMTGDGVNDAPALRQAEVGIAVSSATDVAKKSSSVVLTREGLDGIVELVKNGRTIHQRISTWIMNKIIRSFKRVLFIVLAFVLTGEYVVSTFNMVLLMFLSDYVTLSLSTDNASYSNKPESWDISGMVKVGAYLGLLLVAESTLLLYLGLAAFNLFDNLERLRTFVFEFLVFSGYFTVLVVRERRHFWESQPSKPLSLSMAVNSTIVLLISVFGIPGISPITFIEFLTVLAYSFITCLLLNDFVKTSLARRYRVTS